MIIRILNHIKKKKHINHKNDQSEIKNAISKINNILEGINSKLDEAADQISDLEDKIERSTIQNSKKKKKELKKMRVV